MKESFHPQKQSRIASIFHLFRQGVDDFGSAAAWAILASCSSLLFGSFTAMIVVGIQKLFDQEINGKLLVAWFGIGFLAGFVLCFIVTCYLEWQFDNREEDEVQSQQ